MASSKLHCIIDCSGSMTEYGKPMLLVNLLRYIREFMAQNNKTAHYFCWQKDIVEINWADDMDIELPAAKGNSDTVSLCNWAKQHPDNALLVLTDGYFNLNTQQRHFLSQLDNLYIVAVGGDADLAQLNTLSNHSFCAEEVDCVLHAIYRPKATTIAPLRRVELKKVVARSESEHDEW